MTAVSTTVAMGGERTIPAPDAIARDYLLLALRLGQHVDGLVDGYFGPADLKAQSDMEQRPAPARLADDARMLLDRVATDDLEPDRRTWLTAQVRALETQASVLSGSEVGYETLIERCFDFVPERYTEGPFRAIAKRLDGLLPGDGTVGDRLAALDAATTVPSDRVPAIAEWLAGVFRDRAMPLFGLPEGERLRIGFVRNQPWSGYNWYEGGLRSRVDLNLDLPIRAADLLHVLAHETYPGHHLEHAWKEADLVQRQGRLEASILLINTPECFVSEGLADLGHRFASPPEAEAALLGELLGRAGLAASIAPTLAEVAALRRGLGAAAVDAALMLHADGRPRDEVRDFLVDVALVAPERADKRLSFIEHPLWRAYVFVYSEGAALLELWLGQVAPDEQRRRFARLLHEQLTPSGIAEDLARPA